MTESAKHIVNKHGVFVTFDTVVVSDSDKLKIKILLAEENGLWYAGINYQKGGSSTGDYGGGHYPAKSGPSFGDKDSALLSQLNEMSDYPEEMQAAALKYLNKVFIQPTLF